MTREKTASDAARALEEQRLQHVRALLAQALDTADARIRHYVQDVKDQKTYMAESRDEMDQCEKIASRQSIQQMEHSGDAVAAAQKLRLRKLEASPYFGRVDFRADADETARPVYVGIHHFHDEAARETLVYDWRAPIASLFYDYETGPARYTAPQGEVAGKIALKRQFRIRDGRIELMLDSAVHVVDDVLQEALGEASDENMKNIVATIQRDQNAIIRNEETPVLIIQGVAGSGKTSIALHRIAFLLYRHKDTLSAEDILIISPNRVFSAYISNVLPELGEEAVGEIRMEDLAEEILQGQYRFQSFFEQTAALLEKDEPALRERLQRLVTEIEQKIGIQYNYDLTPEDRRKLRDAVRGMARESSLRQAYQGLCDWLGEPELFRTVRGRLEWADVFPLIYLKLKLERRHSAYARVKHQLVDEMQDYTPVQYAVLERLFRCNKTILGDARQAINPYGSSRPEDIQRAFSQATRVTLNRSYRSSFEITQFARRIMPDPDLIAIERHGEAPRVQPCATARAQREALLAAIEDFRDSEHNSLAVIARSPSRARRWFKTLSEAGVEARLLDEHSVGFGRGVIVCSAHLAKGLEFDRAIVPDADARSYHSTMDRHLLYVACTQAMHRLMLTHVGSPSAYLAGSSD